MTSTHPNARLTAPVSSDSIPDSKTPTTSKQIWSRLWPRSPPEPDLASCAGPRHSRSPEDSAFPALLIWYRFLLLSLLGNSSTTSTASTPFQGRRPGISVAQTVRSGNLLKKEWSPGRGGTKLPARADEFYVIASARRAGALRLFAIYPPQSASTGLDASIRISIPTECEFFLQRACKCQEQDTTRMRARRSACGHAGDQARNIAAQYGTRHAKRWLYSINQRIALHCRSQGR